MLYSLKYEWFLILFNDLISPFTTGFNGKQKADIQMKGLVYISSCLIVFTLVTECSLIVFSFVTKCCLIVFTLVSNYCLIVFTLVQVLQPEAGGHHESGQWEGSRAEGWQVRVSSSVRRTARRCGQVWAEVPVLTGLGDHQVVLLISLTKSTSLTLNSPTKSTLSLSSELFCNEYIKCYQKLQIKI